MPLSSSNFNIAIYSYTEELYTSKSYHLAYYGYSKLIIIIILMLHKNDYYAVLIIVFPTQKDASKYKKFKN